jgi:hypothetical protein
MVNGTTKQATHVCWELIHNEPVPKGMHVLHKCDVPSCVCPDHLFLGTHQENMQDMSQKGRHKGGPGSGDRNHQTKLSENDVKTIYATYHEGGISMAKLGVKYGVSCGTIGDIVCGRTWKHLGLIHADPPRKL